MIGFNIKRLRVGKGYSQEQLARKIGISQGAVSQWEKGKTTPDTLTLMELAKIFEVSFDTLTEEAPVRDLDSVRVIRSAIPIIGDIACGSPILAEENREGYADLPEGVRADFALRCKGDSMVPTFLDGDLVLIRQQPEVENGQIAAVAIDGEVTLKHVYRNQDGLMLTAENPLFAPITVSADSGREIVIYGLAVGYTRLF